MKFVLFMLFMIKREYKILIIYLNRVEIEKLIGMIIGVGREFRDMNWNGKNKIKGKVLYSIKIYY